MENAVTYIFSRTEKKYLIGQDQLDAILPTLNEHMHGDKYGLSTICSMYFDTPDMRIIRASIDAKAYKEKLRLRCYGTPRDDTPAFVEQKKKYLGTVYKRRFTMPYAEAIDFLSGNSPAPDTQMGREVEYFFRFYPKLGPALDIFCERFALFDNDPTDLRLTVDGNIRYRMTDLDLRSGTHGERILDAGRYILEIKTAYGMPLWLTRLLDEHRIFPGKFSKYATAFNMELDKRLNS